MRKTKAVVVMYEYFANGRPGKGHHYIVSSKDSYGKMFEEIAKDIEKMSEDDDVKYIITNVVKV